MLRKKGGMEMSNGGHISCEYCTYNRNPHGQCDIFGVETSPFVLCRAFRKPKQSHADARKEWPMLENLRPGLVCEIDNSTFSICDPKPIYHVSAL